MHRTKSLGVLATVLGLIVFAGCDDAKVESDGAQGEGGSGGEANADVEITSWWSGPGEAEALAALLDVHEDRNPGVNIFNSSANDGTDSELTIEDRLANGDPPDAFQENVKDIPELLEEFPGALEPLNDLFAKNGWNKVFIPEVLDAVTFDGEIYAMPVGVHRENSMFVNRSLFSKYKLEAPTTLPELLSVCETLAADDVTCLATGGQGWIIRIMFLDIVAATMGAQEFQEFFAGEGDPDDPTFVEAVSTMRTILDNYIDKALWIDKDCEDFDKNPIARCLDPAAGWQEGSQALFDGKAALFLHGDWVGGYVQQLGWEAGIDYSVLSAPGTSELFLFGVDVFALPSKAKNKAGALKFFETIGSSEGQAAFNNIKGSTPVRLDADKSLLSPVAKAALEDLSQASVVARAPTFVDMDEMVRDFANGALTEAEFVDVVRSSLYP